MTGLNESTTRAVGKTDAARTGGVYQEAPAPRFVGIDAMRALSIVGVAWIHGVAHTPLQKWNGLGRFGAEYFATAAAFLLLYRSLGTPRKGFLNLFAARFRRLIIPFFARLVVYILLKPLLGWRGVDHVCYNSVADLTWQSLGCSTGRDRVFPVASFLPFSSNLSEFRGPSTAVS